MKLNSNHLQAIDLLDNLDIDPIGPRKASMRRRIRDGEVFEQVRPFRQPDTLMRGHDSELRDRKTLRRSRQAERRGDWISPRLRSGSGKMEVMA